MLLGHREVSLTDVQVCRNLVRNFATCLCARYAMPGTEVACGGTRSATVLGAELKTAHAIHW
eukprot:417704-Rhodomonas_salina.1